MGTFIESRSLAEALGVAAAFFVGLTAFSLAAGYGAQRFAHAQGRKVFDVPLKRGQTRREILGTVLFIALWVPAIALSFWAGLFRFGDGWLREILTFVGSMLAFQAYYWLIHRAMHWQPLFFTHKWHHDSLVTTPLTGFSMSPFEAVGWIVGFIAPAAAASLFVPIGAWGYVGFLTFAWYGNIVGHANAELMPAITSTTWGSRLLSNPVTYHCLHHARFDRHYGFATAWMDALFGTQWDDWIAISKRVRSGEPMRKLRERLPSGPAKET